ncbi:MAG: indolepyruvate oxidoreductase subunit beta [Desulfobacterales bacterium]|nr:indolepyruvate oxidoreductase subunit beta [Desulfobacterales bacterium]
MAIQALTKEPFNMVIAGVGGQGNVLLSAFVGNALLNKGYMISVADTFGVSQRGGSVASHIKISKDTLYSSVTLNGQADVLLGMEPVETLRVLGEFGNPEVITIVNPRPVYPTGGVSYPDLEKVKEAIEQLSAKTSYVNATEVALSMGNPILANIILLGALVGANLLPINKDDMMPILEERFPGKILETNIQAFEKGMAMIAEA